MYGITDQPSNVVLIRTESKTFSRVDRSELQAWIQSLCPDVSIKSITITNRVARVVLGSRDDAVTIVTQQTSFPPFHDMSLTFTHNAAALVSDTTDDTTEMSDRMRHLLSLEHNRMRHLHSLEHSLYRRPPYDTLSDF